MSWRMKLADWISGGEWSEATRLWRELYFNADAGKMRARASNSARGAALREIAHMRTPRCASIGKRMADIAEEALK